jgi:hypothetical protein
MLLRAISSVCENHRNHTNKMCGVNAEFVDVQTASTYSYHCAWKVNQTRCSMRNDTELNECLYGHDASTYSRLREWTTALKPLTGIALFGGMEMRPFL